MQIDLKPQAKEDLDYFKRHQPELIERIKRLHRDILDHPYVGLGKPEPLKYALSGCWSRRITQEHRLVYSVQNDVLTIYQYRYHY